MSINFSIGTATQYDNLPLPPAIGTTSGGIRLNSNISMAVGAKVEFDGLKFNELTHTVRRRIVTSINGADPRVAMSIESGLSILSTHVSGGGSLVTNNPTISTQNYAPIIATIVIIGRLTLEHYNLDTKLLIVIAPFIGFLLGRIVSKIS
jgi:hypothetical protein